VTSHSVGHSAEAAESRDEAVLLQSVTLTFRTGEDVGSRDAESLQNGAERVAMLRGDVVKLGDPTPERDLLCIDDHVDAYLTCFAKAEASIGEAFNFCAGERLTVRALAEKVRDMTGFRNQILWDTIPRRPLDIQVLYGDPTKAKSVLGWEAKVNLNEGLRRTIDFWRKKLAGPERATRTTTT